MTAMIINDRNKIDKIAIITFCYSLGFKHHIYAKRICIILSCVTLTHYTRKLDMEIVDIEAAIPANQPD